MNLRGSLIFDLTGQSQEFSRQQRRGWDLSRCVTEKKKEKRSLQFFLIQSFFSNFVVVVVVVVAVVVLTCEFAQTDGCLGVLTA